MKITLLGTNGWFDTETGSTPCVLFQTDDFDIIFDAGYGFTKVDRYVDGRRPTYLLISHFHLDHLVGLHTLPKNHFRQGLTIIGQPGVTQALHQLFGPPYSAPLDQHPFSVHITELNGVAPALPFGLTALPLIHSGPCLGYRVEVSGKVVTYCTDTGYCANAITLAHNADLFMTECSLAPGETPYPDWPHLGPAEAAHIAIEAHAHQLVLIHFDPTHYPTLASRDAAQVAARESFPASVAGRDGMEFQLA